MQMKLEIDQPQIKTLDSFKEELSSWSQFGTKTHISDYNGVPVFTNEFWTSKQRAAHSLHEISYRACFKPQLPHFFITRLTEKGDYIFDPFMGRGTTMLEANLLGRQAVGNDVNPLSRMLIEARLSPPSLEEIETRLGSIDLTSCIDYDPELEVFFHKDTLTEIIALKDYFIQREASSEIDVVDKWIRMIAINRLTGHSKGFFSVYTLPPNQATTIERQKKINEKRNQIAEYRDTKALILKKSKSLLKDGVQEALGASSAEFLNQNINVNPFDLEAKVRLSVTSPPFLNIVNYKADNWMRCWFANIDSNQVNITQTSNLNQWKELVTNSLNAVAKVTVPGGYFAFEVGEIQSGKLKLEEVVADCASDTAWTTELILINQQDFTKTSNAWGVSNNAKGTNSNRIVLLRLP